MGDFFTSFDDAWDYFIARTEPLEWFYGDFPDDDDFFGEGWLVEPPGEIKDGAVEVQRILAELDWLTPIPEHFLHVWLGGSRTLGNVPAKMRHSGTFGASYGSVNCFHSAVVIQVEAPELRNLIAGTELDAATFLPHMTVAVTNREHDPEELRQALLPARRKTLGRATIAEVKRVRFPAGRKTLFSPWSVAETVPLDIRK